MKRRYGWALGGSLVLLLPWTGCSGGPREFGTPGGGAAGQSGAATSGRGGGQSSSAGNTTAGNSSKAGSTSTAGNTSELAGSSTGGQAGDDVGGSAGNGGSSPNGGSSGTGGGSECAAGKSEACGDCGTRTCDSTTLKWGACTGDGHQQACWKTEAGVALPGTIPAAPKGSCHAGQQTCQATGAWSACVGAVAPAAADDCSTAGNDANCDGTANGGCNCVNGSTRVCGKDTGNCQTGMQTCTNQVWGSCVGEIVAAAADSCATAGDDANCNGVPNEGCACTPGNVATACNDNVACTDEGCNNGVCTHAVSAGYCLISGACVANNTSETGNVCHYCDATANKTGWSNSSTSTSCDDGKYCNGTDTCNGGACTHQYPTNNRCTATGVCALSVCDEANQTCFKSTSTACGTTTDKQCSSTTACGGDVQTRTNTQYCSGTSNSCSGTITSGAFTTSTDCTTDQTCNGSTLSCTTTLGCGSTWCNGSASGSRCWTLNNDTLGLTDAITACQNSTAGGNTDWQLATIYDYLTIDQGCDGVHDSIKDGDSTCYAPPDVNMGVQDCGACPALMGPLTASQRCYWLPSMGTCNLTTNSIGTTVVELYWSQTNTNYGPLGFSPRDNTVQFWPVDSTVKFPYRCTVLKP